LVFRRLTGSAEVSGCAANAKQIEKASGITFAINALYDGHEKKYWRAVDRDITYRLTDDLIRKYEKKIRSLSSIYAENYAARVFHDRQLCEHLSKTLVAIGFDGTSDGAGPPKQWIDRPSSWPTWAVNAVVARDRGLCALCGVSITAELRAARHIDHIVPLARAGTNDLSNLQLLCDRCNGKKSAKAVDVRNSVPDYLKGAGKRRESKE
jgi:hypothetical protein